MEDNTYKDVADVSRKELDIAIRQNNVDVRIRSVISIALYHEDAEWVTDVCKHISRHTDSTVRGNAILGFGHLARRFGSLDEATVKPIIEQGLSEIDTYVSGQAWAAASDVTHFLRWKVSGFEWDLEGD